SGPVSEIPQVLWRQLPRCPAELRRKRVVRGGDRTVEIVQLLRSEHANGEAPADSPSCVGGGPRETRGDTGHSPLGASDRLFRSRKIRRGGSCCGGDCRFSPDLGRIPRRLPSGVRIDRSGEPEQPSPLNLAKGSKVLGLFSHIRGSRIGPPRLRALFER